MLSERAWGAQVGRRSVLSCGKFPGFRSSRGGPDGPDPRRGPQPLPPTSGPFSAGSAGAQLPFGPGWCVRSWRSKHAAGVGSPLPRTNCD